MSDDKRGRGRGPLVAWLRDGWQQSGAAAAGVGVDRLGRARPSATAVVNADGVWQEKAWVQGVTFELIWVPAGEFRMGSPENEAWRGDDETRHTVRLTRGFWLGRTPVTQRQWEAVMVINPSYFQHVGLDAPVEQVSWDDCQKLLGDLSRTAGRGWSQPTGRGWRLPTEAEWEYGCRAGAETRWCFGDDERELTQYAWHDDNADDRTHPVASLKPNAWGLYDMHGNVWEWVQDWYGDYPEGKVITDPTGPSDGSRRVFRGGGWLYNGGYCRSACRNHLDPGYRSNNLGVRLARDQR